MTTKLKLLVVRFRVETPTERVDLAFFLAASFPPSARLGAIWGLFGMRERVIIKDLSWNSGPEVLWSFAKGD